MKIARTCRNCRTPFMARTADVKRGWAKFCSKSCKANDQERRTGNYRALAEHDEADPRDVYHPFSGISLGQD